jgi:hypothetical protein
MAPIILKTKAPGRKELIPDYHLFEMLFKQHARGATLEEIEEVLLSGTPVFAKYQRLGTRKMFNVDQEWRGKRYLQKMVEVYHVVEGDAFVVVTVYVFFGTWESRDEDRIQ